MNTKFYNISIRARFAFTVLCLENAIKMLNQKNSLWELVLANVWSLTSMKFVDEWLYKISRIMPSSILEDDYEDNDEISYSQYNELKTLYLKTPQIIFDIMEYIFECGTVDLYGKVVDNSPKTLKILDDLVILMEENKIPLPDIKLLEKYPFSENEGWGREFEKGEIGYLS